MLGVNHRTPRTSRLCLNAEGFGQVGEQLTRSRGTVGGTPSAGS